MSQHARLSPSKRHRWAVCPGSVREEDKYPNRVRPSAVEGTKDHALLSYCLDSGVHTLPSVTPETMIDKTISIDGTLFEADESKLFKIDKARADRVKIAFDYVCELISEKKANIKSEIKVDPVFLTGRDDLYGTSDVIATYEKTLEVIDYKGGRIPISAEENDQMMQYAIGVLSEFKIKTEHDFMYPFDTIKLTIIQPKNKESNLEPITSWEVPIKYVLDSIPRLTAEALATDDPNAPLVPNEEGCLFCRAKDSCPARQAPGVELLIRAIAEKTPPRELCANALRQIKDNAKMIKSLLEDVDAEILSRGGVPGYKIVAGRGSRSWSLPENETAEKLVRMGIPKGEVWVKSLISPAQAEKLEWVHRSGEVSKLTNRQIEMMNLEYVKYSEGRPTVVPDSDNREPIKFVDVSSLFKPVE